MIDRDENAARNLKWVYEIWSTYSSWEELLAGLPADVLNACGAHVRPSVLALKAVAQAGSLEPEQKQEVDSEEAIA